MEGLGVLLGRADLPATEEGRPSLEGAALTEVVALGVEYFVEILLAGGTMAEVRLTGETSLPGSLASLVPGRLLSTLIAEAGRDGGPMGLCGAKKLDLRLSVPGVAGSRERLSTVRSDNERRDDRFTLGVDGSSSKLGGGLSS